MRSLLNDDCLTGTFSSSRRHGDVDRARLARVADEEGSPIRWPVSIVALPAFEHCAGRLRARELQQRPNVVVVCSTKGCNVSSARFADVGQVLSTPRKEFLTESRHH